MNPAISLLMLGTLLISVPGCMENIALIGRPSIAEGENDIVGEVERVDLGSRRIYLRPDRGDSRIVAFRADAQVLYRGREYPVSRLEPGDLVAMQMMRRDSRGDSYAHLIRLQESVRDQSRSGLRESAPQIQALSGRVEGVDFRRNSFDLNDQPGKPLLVVLSENARDSDRERFRTLRTGDRVRIEGKFTGPDRFELLSFLNDNS
jgi:hypothetical protein